jgi:hypothetical protein
MNIPTMIHTLENQVRDLKRALLGTEEPSIPGGGAVGAINFMDTDPAGKTEMFLTLLPDGGIVIGNVETRDAEAIGNAILKFQEVRAKKSNAKVLSLVPKGDA